MVYNRFLSKKNTSLCQNTKHFIVYYSLWTLVLFLIVTKLFSSSYFEQKQTTKELRIFHQNHKLTP